MVEPDGAPSPGGEGHRIDALAGSLLRHTSDLAWFTDADGLVFHANPAARETLGPAVADGADGFAAFTVASRALTETDIKPRLAGGRRWAGELTARGVHGPIPLSVIVSPLPGATAFVCRDQRSTARIEAVARHDAVHDRLTGLRNRDGLASAAEVALAQGRAAALLVQIDDLGLVNLLAGAHVADTVLRELADRVRRCLREGDVAARVDGDRLAVLLPGRSSQEATTVGHRVLDALVGADHLGQGQRLAIHVGVAAGPPRSGLADLLLRAEIAVADGRAARPAGGVTAYDEQGHEARAGIAQLRLDLADAVGEGQLTLAYQPLVTLPGGEVYGVEALMRWNHPTIGTITPDVFIPMLEETGLIAGAGAWVLDEALRQLTVWDASAPGSDLSVNVNVSGHQVGPDLVRTVADALGRHGVAPGRLTLELTESVLVDDPARAIETLGELRRIGVGVAIDDFGTGYSSLAALHQLPADILKIDRTFIRDLDGKGGLLVKLMCQIAHTLGMVTVAEGVEEPAQADALVGFGCDRGQGFLWSRPLPPHEVLAR